MYSDSGARALASAAAASSARTCSPSAPRMASRGLSAGTSTRPGRSGSSDARSSNALAGRTAARLAAAARLASAASASCVTLSMAAAVAASDARISASASPLLDEPGSVDGAGAGTLGTFASASVASAESASMVLEKRCVVSSLRFSDREPESSEVSASRLRAIAERRAADAEAAPAGSAGDAAASAARRPCSAAAATAASSRSSSMNDDGGGPAPPAGPTKSSSESSAYACVSYGRRGEGTARSLARTTEAISDMVAPATPRRASVSGASSRSSTGVCAPRAIARTFSSPISPSLCSSSDASNRVSKPPPGEEAGAASSKGCSSSKISAPGDSGAPGASAPAPLDDPLAPEISEKAVSNALSVSSVLFFSFHLRSKGALISPPPLAISRTLRARSARASSSILAAISRLEATARARCAAAFARDASFAFFARIALSSSSRRSARTRSRSNAASNAETAAFFFSPGPPRELVARSTAATPSISTAAAAGASASAPVSACPAPGPFLARRTPTATPVARSTTRSLKCVSLNVAAAILRPPRVGRATRASVSATRRSTSFFRRPSSESANAAFFARMSSRVLSASAVARTRRSAATKYGACTSSSLSNSFPSAVSCLSSALRSASNFCTAISRARRFLAVASPNAAASRCARPTPTTAPL